MLIAELEELGLHRRSLFAIRAGERVPHPRNRRTLTEHAAAFAKTRLKHAGQVPPPDDLVACAAYDKLFSERN